MTPADRAPHRQPPVHPQGIEPRAFTALLLTPGNRLEALAGDRQGQHSLRINDQLRICFRWTKDGPEDVEIVDYH